MNDSTRFTLAQLAVVGATVTGLVTLTACEGGSGGTVSGRLDDVKYVASVPAVKAVTHTEERRERRTKQSCTGTGTKSVCKTVDDGYKTTTVTVTDRPGKPGKSALYCVELDDVNGKTDRDDQWYAVSSSTYHKWVGQAEGVKVKKMPYERELHACTN